VDRVVIGPKMFKEIKYEVVKIRHNLNVAQDRQKSYANMKKVHREFKVGEHVYLRVKPMKIFMNLGGCVKLAPRYCEPFEVLYRIGPIADRIALPAYMKTRISEFLRSKIRLLRKIIK